MASTSARTTAAIAAARDIVGPDRIVGVSCYDDLARAQAAVAAGADYVAFGSFFPSTVKPLARRAEISLLGPARALGVPIVAIGGITAINARELIARRRERVAVITAVFDAPDVEAARARDRPCFSTSIPCPPCHEPQRRTLHSRPAHHSRRRQFAGPRLPLRRRHAALLRARQGAHLWDADGKRYIDYVGSWGPAILGHAHPAVVKAVVEIAPKGLSFGAPTEIEVEMAETLCRLLPSIEMVRLVSSGTEATMSALRLARGFTGRSKIVKFEGCYHGHGDSLLVKAGSGALTLRAAIVRRRAARDRQRNDRAALQRSRRGRGGVRAGRDDIACIIVEPVVGNMNLIMPRAGFLQGLRAVCDQYGAVLIFDEVMTGFRVHPRGVQGLFGVTPDLTTLGKVIGGGMPVGAFGGKRAIMEKIAPLGPVYQAGTLSGNPVAVAAGLATLKEIQAPGFYDKLAVATKSLTDGLTAAAKRAGVPFAAQSVGGMFGIYFADRVPDSYDTVMAGDKARFNTFFHAMLEDGVYFAPSAFEAGFVSAAHTGADIDETIRLAAKAFR